MILGVDNNKEELSSDKKNEKKDNNIEKKTQKILTEDGKLFEINGKNTLGMIYPNCLKDEIETHIRNWIDSAITSFSMIENIDFRIMKERNYREIVSVDFSNTDVSQSNMVWNSGFHQIFQIINDFEIFPENINSNFLLNIPFFQRYNELYGIIETIGSKISQEILQQLYKVQLFFVRPNLKLKKEQNYFLTMIINGKKNY